jgi:chromate transporter
MNIYLDLFLTFAKIGLFTFGGGLAMLPMLQAEVVNKKHWATDEDLVDYFAVGQCTPGIIAVNTASFVGYYQRGIKGCICATAGIIFPSLVIILTLATVLQNFADLPVVQHALSGIRIAVCVLIVQAVWKMAKSSVKNSFGAILFLTALILSLFTDVSPILIVLMGAAAGVLWQMHLARSKT